jgi:hypothetical protein
MTSTQARDRKKVRLSEAQNHRCCYCGMVCYTNEEIQAHIKNTPKSHRTISNLEMVTFEHIMRQCDKGPDHHSNLVIACHLCNSIRSNRTAEEHYKWIQKNLDYIVFRKKWAYRLEHPTYIETIKEKYTNLGKQMVFENPNFFPDVAKKIIYVVSDHNGNHLRSFFKREHANNFCMSFVNQKLDIMEMEVF